MSFIRIHNKKGEPIIINLRYVEEVRNTDLGACIYMAHNCPDAIEQDYIMTKESFSDICKLIREGGIE